MYFVSEASHIIPASRIGWMGRARGRRGPQKHSKTCDHFNEKASLSRYRHRTLISYRMLNCLCHLPLLGIFMLYTVKKVSDIPAQGKIGNSGGTRILLRAETFFTVYTVPKENSPSLYPPACKV
jgi:hypothetical protein